METAKFEQQCAAMEKAQEHAQEIRNTRIGGLGGSDAAILYKIGERGLGALTVTDQKRLAIMLGLVEQDDWGGNVYTQAGHMFEDYAEQYLPLNSTKQREEVIERKLAINFRTFAHADFTERNDGELSVIECKFVQDTTANTISKYYAQLQWYYMLGANLVYLYHGTGTSDPFVVETGEVVPVERDEMAIKILLAGIETLDKAISKGWKPENVEKIELESTPEMIQRAFMKMAELKAKEAELKAEKEAASAILKEYIEDWGLSGIVANLDRKYQVTYTHAVTKFAFNVEKFLKEHPEFDRPEYYKATKVKSSVTFK